MPVKKSLSPVQRTLRELRNQGFVCDVTEKFNPYGGPIIKGVRVGVRQDLFGFIDLIALTLEKTIAIQCCTGSGLAEHRRKILENEHAIDWLRSGRDNCIEIWAWRKVVKKRGGKQMIWQPRIEEITIDLYG